MRFSPNGSPKILIFGHIEMSQKFDGITLAK